MRKELIGIIICILLTSVAIAPATNALTIEKNEINEAKEPSQPAEWPPDDEIIHKGFGLISNPKRGMDEWYSFWSFNCIFVRCVLVDEYGHRHTHLFENGEVRYIIGDPTIITKHFMYDPIFPFHFYWIVE